MLIRSPVVGGSRRSRNCSSEVVACSVSLIDIKDFAEMNEAFGCIWWIRIGKAYKAFWPEHAELGGLPSRVPCHGPVVQGFDLRFVSPGLCGSLCAGRAGQGAKNIDVHR